MSRLPLLRLMRYGKPYQTQVWSAIACSILNTIFDLAPPYLIGFAIDVVVNEESSLVAQFGLTSITGQLTLLSLLTLLIWSLESLSQYGYSRLWRNLAQTLQHEMRVDAYSHLQNLEISYLEDRSTGTVLSVLNDDINQLERFLDHGAHHILFFFTTVLFVGSTFIALAPGISGWAMVPIPFVVWGSIWFQARLEPRYADVREKSGLISRRLANNLSGMAYRRSNAKAIALSAAFVPLIRIVILIGFTATLFLGGMAVAQGRLSPGTYGFIVFIIQRLLWPFTELSEVMDEYQRAMASVRRVMGLLDTPIAIPQGDRALSHVRGEVEFDGVTFAYAGRETVLQQLSLSVPAGTTIGIVGATGSGKSTLVKLLLRFYEVQNGRVTIDGVDIRELRLGDLRHSIGWVSQDVFLFPGTVAENIRYGSFEATREQIIQAAKLAEAHGFIEQLPQSYDTIVGERGQKLSGGQRQRLAIARAILKDPPILVLDEATSAVDNETEAAIQRSLAKITQNRTTIVIAHRLSTIRRANRIYVIDKGEIAEQGNHKKLLTQNGIYANLWRVQSGDALSGLRYPVR